MEEQGHNVGRAPQSVGEGTIVKMGKLGVQQLQTIKKHAKDLLSQIEGEIQALEEGRITTDTGIAIMAAEMIRRKNGSSGDLPNVLRYVVRPVLPQSSVQILSQVSEEVGKICYAGVHKYADALAKRNYTPDACVDSVSRMLQGQPVSSLGMPSTSASTGVLSPGLGSAQTPVVAAPTPAAAVAASAPAAAPVAATPVVASAAPAPKSRSKAGKDKEGKDVDSGKDTGSSSPSVLGMGTGMDTFTSRPGLAVPAPLAGDTAGVPVRATASAGVVADTERAKGGTPAPRATATAPKAKDADLEGAGSGGVKDGTPAHAHADAHAPLALASSGPLPVAAGVTNPPSLPLVTPLRVHAPTGSSDAGSVDRDSTRGSTSVFGGGRGGGGPGSVSAPTPIATSSHPAAVAALAAYSKVQMKEVLQRLKKHKDGDVFDKPVKEEDAPGYYAIITRPIDLTTLGEQVESGEVSTWETFRELVALMFANCIEYNTPGTEYANIAVKMEKDVAPHMAKAESLIAKEAKRGPRFVHREAAVLVSGGASTGQERGQGSDRGSGADGDEDEEREEDGEDERSPVDAAMYEDAVDGRGGRRATGSRAVSRGTKEREFKKEKDPVRASKRRRGNSGSDGEREEGEGGEAAVHVPAAKREKREGEGGDGDAQSEAASVSESRQGSTRAKSVPKGGKATVPVPAIAASAPTAAGSMGTRGKALK